MSYVRNAWYVASWDQDLAIEKPFAINILGERIVIYSAGGRLVGLEDRCVHRLAPLSLGRCEGERLRCMYHGLLFDPDGRVVEIPGQDLVPANARVKSYPVAARHSWIWVWMGDPARADEALIPPAVGFDDPNWILGRGQLDYYAEARLINDNLLDFSHLTYVHANSFGSSDTWAKDRPKITMLDRGIRFERWLRVEGGKDLGSDQPYDRYSTYDFMIPGVLLMTGGDFAVGTAAALDHGVPDMADALTGVTFTSQAVTPMGDRSARYFFSWGPHVAHGDVALRDSLMQLADMAFGEDKTIIEAQQRVIDQTADPKIMPTTADRGIILYNRLVERLARDDHPAGMTATG